MPSSLSTTCLATLAMIGNKPAVTVGFNNVVPLLERKHNQEIRNKVRVRLRSSSSNKPDDTRRRMVPPPKRRSRADIDASSVDKALASLNLSGVSSGRSHRRKQQQLQQQKRKDSSSSPDDNSKPSTACPPDPRLQILADVHRYIAERNILGAVSTLELVTRGEKRDSARTSEDEAALRAAFSTVLNECGRSGLWREAKQVVTIHMPTAAVEPSGSDWIQAIDACAGPGGAGQAILYLHDMRAT